MQRRVKESTEWTAQDIKPIPHDHQVASRASIQAFSLRGKSAHRQLNLKRTNGRSAHALPTISNKDGKYLSRDKMSQHVVIQIDLTGAQRNHVAEADGLAGYYQRAQ